MAINKPVPLIRYFAPITQSKDASDEQEILSIWGRRELKTWSDIDEGYRTVILAEAGAGKTFEMLARAHYAEEHGRAAFFIRIEDIDENFEGAFEVGSRRAFETWLRSKNEAWFYLDSVDEARLENPRAFEKAVQRFSAKIMDAQLRAHICISSRPYAWRPRSDRDLMERYLPLERPQAEPTGENSEPSKSLDRARSALEIYSLRPLHEDDVRLFAAHRAAPNVDRLMRDLERSNLMAMASRPFDLEGVLSKWKLDQVLGGRRELLRHNIQHRLEEFDQDRAGRQPLNLGRARDGARRLAAAVILTGESGIRVPDNTHERIGVDAKEVLAEWEPSEVQTLLDRAIFNDVIYGAVRFRHREIRELLAAEWFSELLQNGNSRHDVETLIFREQYGENVISPRLRPILPWLILDDGGIRSRSLEMLPEVAVEGGDPAELPLPERKSILSNIVERIVRNEDDRGARDNSAIARIAQPDLTSEALALINRHGDNDEAIFFLGRLVWQGEMSACVPALLPLAADPTRGIYSRIAATRAVMTCGTNEQKSILWSSMLAAQAELPREIFAELLQEAAADAASVGFLLQSIDKLPPYERFETTGLTQALHEFIDRIPVETEVDAEALTALVRGLDAVLDRPPHIERRECKVSKDFAWLLMPATHVIEKLVSARLEVAREDHAISVMLKTPAARFWQGEDSDDYKSRLRELVPAWPELNDKLFWTSISDARVSQLQRDGQALTDDWPVQILGHYWAFGPDRFSDVLQWVKSRPLEDDKLVALSLAFRIYAAENEPAEWLDQLRTAAIVGPALEARLDNMLHPTVSETARKWQEEDAEREKKREQQRLKEKRDRSVWIARLKACPDRVRYPPGMKPGEFSNDQYWLLREIEGDGLRTSRGQGADWGLLVEDFGADVAQAFRDAARAHWRHFRPEVRSEGGDTGSIPYSLIFAMAGLEMEALETENFPANLSEFELRHALRYIVWELNGFPNWLEAAYRARPRTVMEFIKAELFWELAHTKPDLPIHYIFHDLVYYAPWLHGALVAPLIAWAQKRPLPTHDALRYCLHILKYGRAGPKQLAAIAKSMVGKKEPEAQPYWYATWVDVEPDLGVPAVKSWLDRLQPHESSRSAQLFIAALVGSRHRGDSGPSIGNFRTATHLKALYVLMHRFIRLKDDIERAGKGVYSPELRDDAQDARNQLFNMLAEIAGKETYIALKELAQDHPDPDCRPWMAKKAFERAERDGDLEPWSAKQVHEFGSTQTRTPATHRQLFDLTVARLTDLKHWLERGNDSPFATWQRVEGETEMRNLVTGWLNQHWGNRFTTAQEPELANSQRMDIWLQNQNVRSPVPIELKLLDKGWSGPKLCERLRNQLVGDYLREETAGSGVMLLIWQGRKTGRRWIINGHRVGVDGLQNALKAYWESISNGFSNVSAIEVVVIDLTVRSTKSVL